MLLIRSAEVSAVYSYVPFNAATHVRLLTEAPVGSIVSFDKNAYRLSDKSYDSKIVGVVVEHAEIVIEEGLSQSANTLMINRGEAKILVNGETGAIETGDFLTASSIPGQAMKADKDGIVVGVALESFHPKSMTDSSLIKGVVDIRFTTVGDTFSADSLGLSRNGIISSLRHSISEVLGFGLGALAGVSPIVRYVLAVIVVVIAFASGFFLFGRIALQGVEALGRNPLARRTILMGITMNAFFTIVLIAFAILLAYIIVVV